MHENASCFHDNFPRVEYNWKQTCRFLLNKYLGRDHSIISVATVTNIARSAFCHVLNARNTLIKITYSMKKNYIYLAFQVDI